MLVGTEDGPTDQNRVAVDENYRCATTGRQRRGDDHADREVQVARVVPLDEPEVIDDVWSLEGNGLDRRGVGIRRERDVTVLVGGDVRVETAVGRRDDASANVVPARVPALHTPVHPQPAVEETPHLLGQGEPRAWVAAPRRVDSDVQVQFAEPVEVPHVNAAQRAVTQIHDQHADGRVVVVLCEGEELAGATDPTGDRPRHDRFRHLPPGSPGVLGQSHLLLRQAGQRPGELAGIDLTAGPVPTAELRVHRTEQRFLGTDFPSGLPKLGFPAHLLVHIRLDIGVRVRVGLCAEPLILIDQGVGVGVGVRRI
ncbi:hypothetical protein AB0M48_12185 [Lentzea sp. NPDC051208]|uniref:hypothetical protein n=1 Tax=Lentzea sp. NPDC051208 TaxID=3154642 RepID=UPI0034313227